MELSSSTGIFFKKQLQINTSTKITSFLKNVFYICNKNIILINSSPRPNLNIYQLINRDSNQSVCFYTNIIVYDCADCFIITQSFSLNTISWYCCATSNYVFPYGYRARQP